MIRKFLAVIAASAAISVLAACQPNNTTPANQPPNPPAAAQPQGGNVHIFELFVRTFDCRPINNPAGDCSDEVRAFFTGSITVIGTPPPNGTSHVVDNKTGQTTSTKMTFAIGTYPYHGEFTVDEKMASVVWIAHMDRLPPGSRIRCDLFNAGDLTRPIPQAGNFNDVVNDGDTTTSGDAICGWPLGFAVPKLG